jgi:uroporphyrin-3 C-methyltransferase
MQDASPDDARSAGAPGGAQRPGRDVPAPGAAAALWIAAAALALAAWQWYDRRGEIADLREEVARRLADGEARDREIRALAEQVREAVADAREKLGALEARVAESQSQQIALETLYQDLSRNRDEWAYAEIEQALFLASQQLALAGNVKGALIALQGADARLQRMDRPQLRPLRKAINRDIERLKASPHVDTVAISARLDTLVALVDALPLAMEARPPADTAAAEPAQAGGWWSRFWREAWAELRQLLRVQRIDRPEIPLLAPDQSYFLRENLKLRLIGARLALLARDAPSYKADLKAARDWIGRYYDARNKNVAYAQGVLRNLHDAEIGIEAPDISASLEAMRALRIVRERGAR